METVGDIENQEESCQMAVCSERREPASVFLLVARDPLNLDVTSLPLFSRLGIKKKEK